jgi:hypothetical protein
MHQAHVADLQLLDELVLQPAEEGVDIAAVAGVSLASMASVRALPVSASVCGFRISAETSFMSTVTRMRLPGAAGSSSASVAA